MRHTPRTVLALTAALFLAACPTTDDEAGTPVEEPGPEAPGEAPPAEVPPAQVPPADQTDPSAADISLPSLLAGLHDRTDSGELPVLDRMPPPRETRRETVQNRHDPTMTDTVVTRVYPGLEVEVYRVTSSGKEIVRSIVVTGEEYRTSERIGPGSTRAEVTAALGEPASVDGSTLEYQVTEGEPDPAPTDLSIELADGVVQRMTWDYYID